MKNVDNHDNFHSYTRKGGFLTKPKSQTHPKNDARNTRPLFCLELVLKHFPFLHCSHSSYNKHPHLHQTSQIPCWKRLPLQSFSFLANQNQLDHLVGYCCFVTLYFVYLAHGMFLLNIFMLLWVCVCVREREREREGEGERERERDWERERERERERVLGRESTR
jgi:hypothetical protein